MQQCTSEQATPAANCWPAQVAPLLLAGPRAREGQQYQQANSQFTLGKGGGMISQIVPGQAGQQLQAGGGPGG